MMCGQPYDAPPYTDEREAPADVTVDLLAPDAFTCVGGYGPETEALARENARAYLRNRLAYDLAPGYARLHLPDEYGRPNRRLVLMGPGPDDEQEVPDDA